MLTAAQCEHARNLLEELGDRIRHAVEGSRRDLSIEQMAEVAAVTEADTIYGIDKVSEELILEWLDEHWPAELACELVMEGLEEERVLPHGVAPVTKLILDPIDGTRGLMYDKRSAWALAGLALHRGDRTSLQDIQVAVMTELPTARQTDWDQLSAIRGGAQDTINDAGQQIVRRQLNVAPTLTIRPGFPVRVVVTRDLVLEPYGG